MRSRHQQALKKSVMLGHTGQTSWVMQNVHDRSQNLPDPDIFAVDREGLEANRVPDADMHCMYVWVWKHVGTCNYASPAFL